MTARRASLLSFVFAGAPVDGASRLAWRVERISEGTVEPPARVISSASASSEIVGWDSPLRTRLMDVGE
jgi:hypothetical protein